VNQPGTNTDQAINTPSDAIEHSGFEDDFEDVNETMSGNDDFGEVNEALELSGAWSSPEKEMKTEPTDSPPISSLANPPPSPTPTSSPHPTSPYPTLPYLSTIHKQLNHSSYSRLAINPIPAFTSTPAGNGRRNFSFTNIPTQPNLSAHSSPSPAINTPSDAIQQPGLEDFENLEDLEDFASPNSALLLTFCPNPPPPPSTKGSFTEVEENASMDMDVTEDVDTENDDDIKETFGAPEDDHVKETNGNEPTLKDSSEVGMNTEDGVCVEAGDDFQDTSKASGEENNKERGTQGNQSTDTVLMKENEELKERIKEEVKIGKGVEATKSERINVELKVEKSKVKGGTCSKFTAAEDEVIRAAMDADGNVDSVRIGKQLGRNNGSVISRAEILHRTGGVRRKQCITLAEDLTLLETLILPRLKVTKLSKIKLLKKGAKEMAQGMCNRNEHSFAQRWSKFLQPILLQHYTGTLNLRVERMLVNHIAEKFTDLKDIRWEEVAERVDFSGHTTMSLKAIFSNLKLSTSRKFNIARSAVDLNQVALYTEQVYGKDCGKMTPSEAKVKRQENVIAFFEGKVEELGLKDFL